MSDTSATEEIKDGFEQQLRFERLLSDIATNFISLPGYRIDSEILTAQKLICECLGIDLCVLFQISDDLESLILSHIHAPHDFNPPPEDMNAMEQFPWLSEQMFLKKTVILTHVSDAPVEAETDKKSWDYYNIRGVLVFPLFAGGSEVFGSLSFGVMDDSRDWPAYLVSRLQLVAQIFSSAFARKRTVDALNESEIRLTMAAESANAGLWSWDFKTGIIWCTEKTRRLYGLRLDEIITMEIFIKTLHPDDRDSVMDEANRVIRGGLSLKMKYRIILPNSQIRWMSVMAHGIHFPNGEPERLMGVSIDISQEVKNESDLSELRIELEHITRIMTLNEISASLAHEINQPLGAILNNASAAEMLLEKPEDHMDELHEILTDVRRDSMRAGDIIRKIRGLAQKGDVNYESLDPNSLIEDVLSLFRGSISLQDITIVMDLEPGLPKICGDRVRLQQVLMNFMTNAVEAVQTSSEKVITVHSGLQDQKTLLVSVADTGTGIDDLVLERVFEPFFTTKVGGLGMGLSICRSIIEEHKGSIQIEKNPDGGSVLSFSLKTLKGSPRD